MPTCEMDSAEVVHYLFISYWVNINYCEDSKKNKFTTNVSSFTTFLIVLFHELNKLTHLVAHAYLLTGASKGQPIFLLVLCKLRFFSSGSGCFTVLNSGSSSGCFKYVNSGLDSGCFISISGSLVTR